MFYNRGNKYAAKRTYSELCGRTFDSKAEAKRGEELALLLASKKIAMLEYQKSFVLCEKPKISIKIDFVYRDLEGKQWVYEDVKGFGETREFRVKKAWLKEKHGIEITIVGGKKK